MALFDKLAKLEYLNQLIGRESTGTPKELSRKLNVTERTVYNLLEVLRIYGAKITYSASKESFIFLNEIKLCFDPIKRGRGGK
jgi:transcriptional antiterminator